MSVKVKELFRCAFEFDPLPETVAQQILLKILALLKRDFPKQLPESKQDALLDKQSLKSEANRP